MSRRINCSLSSIQSTLLFLAHFTHVLNDVSYFDEALHALLRTPSQKYNKPEPVGDMKKIEVTGDGRCLHRSMIVSLVDELSYLPLGVEEETILADALRHLAWQMLSKNRREFVRDFIGENYENYIEQMLDPKFYAGQVEIVILSDIIETRVEICIVNIENGKRNVSYKTFSESSTRQIELFDYTTTV